MIDFEKIKAIYKLGKELSLQDIQLLIAAATPKSFAPTAYLIEEGATKREIHFIVKGLVRVFIVNDKGEEITSRVVTENHPATSSDIILFNRPSRFYIQAIEPTKTLTIDFDELQLIIEKHPKLMRLRRNILFDLLRESTTHIESFILLSPEERYLQFVENYADICSRIPDKYIANILGITPVSLSRIRKRIAGRK